MADYPLTIIAEFIGNIGAERLRQLVKEGIVPKGKKGKYDLKDTVQAYVVYLQGLSKGKDNTKTQYEKNIKEEESITKKIIRLRLEGKLVDAAEVKRAAFNDGRKIRDSIDSLPARLAPLLAVESDANKVFKIMDQEIRKVLEGAKNDKEVEG